MPATIRPTYRISLLLFLLLISFSGLYAQQSVRKLTLDEAVAMALDQSPDALVARQTFRNSYWQYRTFKADYLPALTLQTTLPNFYQSISSELDSGIRRYFPQQFISANARLDLSQKIGLTGGTISLQSGLEGTYNYKSSVPRTYVSSPVGIQLNQPIFKYNPYRWLKKIEPLKYAKAKRKYVEDMEQIRITTANVFFALLQAQVERNIQLKNLSNNDTLYRIAQGRFQLGKIAENDKLQLELNYLRAKAAVENADLALENALFRFKSFLRLQDTTGIELIPPTETDFFLIDPNRAVALFKENSSASLEFRRRLLAADQAVNQARLSGRFDADLTASYGLQKRDITIPDVYRYPNESKTLALTLTIPILDWGVARGQIKMAQSEQEIVKKQVEQDAIDSERDVYLKAVQFNMQRNQLAIAAKSDTVAKKSFEVIKGRYMIGKINSILDLNNAQIENDNAVKNYYNALQIYWQSYFQIRKMTLWDFKKQEALPFDLNEFK